MILEQNKIYKYWYAGEGNKYGAECRYKLVGSTLYVVFVGSNFWRDWLDNFRFWHTVEIDGVKIHRAWYYYAFKFYRYYKHNILPDNHIGNIVIIGHSLGGAVGDVFKFIRHRYYGVSDFIQTYGYGSPRPFKGVLSEDFCRTINHIWNKGDIVPKLPWWRNVYGNNKYSEQKWKVFWKAHLEYDKIIWF